MDKLKTLRNQLDKLDSEISILLDKRMQTVNQIGEVKRQHHIMVTDKSREEEVLNNVKAFVHHPVLKENMVNIYKTIMEESKIIQHFFHHLKCPFQKVGIIGMGLMGGSICKALKMKDASIEIAYISKSVEDRKQAVLWADIESSSLIELIESVEMIIIASPISSVIEIAMEINRQSACLNKKLVVIDIASVKAEIVSQFEQLTNAHVEFVGTHPMAGKETSGFEGSQATLFVRRPWIISSHQKNSLKTLNDVTEFVRFMGADPLQLQAVEHDRKVALISHLPGILSKLFFDFVNHIDTNSRQIAGPGFDSFTRLAHANQELRSEIKKSNHLLIEDLMHQWIEFLQKGGKA